MLYNGMLRGFGDCGEVPSDVESNSDAFWEHLKKVSVTARIDKAGHKFSSTMHALSSGIKKIQGIAEDGQGTRLYRGLGKLITPFFSTSYSSLIIFKSPLGKAFNHLFLICTHQVGWMFGRLRPAQALPRRHSCRRPAT